MVGRGNLNKNPSDAKKAFSLTCQLHHSCTHNATTWTPCSHQLTAYADSKEHVWGFWEYKPLYSLSINPFTVVFIPLAWGDGGKPKCQTCSQKYHSKVWMPSCVIFAISVIRHQVNSLFSCQSMVYFSIRCRRLLNALIPKNDPHFPSSLRFLFRLFCKAHY